MSDLDDVSDTIKAQVLEDMFATAGWRVLKEYLLPKLAQSAYARAANAADGHNTVKAVAEANAVSQLATNIEGWARALRAKK